MAEGRKGISGYVVSTGGGGNKYVKNKSGVVVTNTGGNLSTMVPSYSSPSLHYGPMKDNLVGNIVSAPS